MPGRRRPHLTSQRKLQIRCSMSSGWRNRGDPAFAAHDIRTSFADPGQPDPGAASVTVGLRDGRVLLFIAHRQWLVAGGPAGHGPF